ncbi:hypothetical protein [Dokdonia pacifica]|uniref:Uncharacterized protein n=1 Tax=Dokdonia pacifica TaxID=1627892 RepID=A0A238VPB6_9FLAO|nr:hypothetical protein [Dokdonia pacifica]SNR36202.1 hypothetical protein SAMN06265376_101152 [Dokdonia pacifica]
MGKLIFWVVFVLSILSLFLFKTRNQRLKILHEQREKVLKEQLDKNKKQIQKRHRYLKMYKLLAFNLEESLHVQEEIDVYFK